jgi:hypothetical protein
VAPGTRAQQNKDFARLELQTIKVADGLYVLMGGPAQGNNIVASVGNDGVFLVDTMYGQMHQKIVDAVRHEDHSRKPTKEFDETDPLSSPSGG